MKLLLITSVLAFLSAASASKVVFCYYGTWANWRTGNGKFTPANINPHLCTHIGYSFFGITADGVIKSLDSYVDFKDNWGLGYIQDVIDLKKVNPNLKVLAVVGGYEEGSTKYSETAADPVKRKNFVDSSLALVLEHGFDGLDLDWEYPAQRGGAASDKANFVTWLKELKTEYKKKNLLLTIAVGSTSNLAEPSYDIPAISQHLDFINLMTYDMYGSWDKFTGENAPLYNTGTHSVDKAVTYWLQQGAPASKLVLGLAFYGRTFTLAKLANNGIGAAAPSPGHSGPFTKQPGFLGYNEICLDKTWNVVWDNEQRVPYAYRGIQWVGYDNVQSIGEKVNYALSKNLAGVMIWSIETDDFRGDCGDGQYPLLNKAFSTVNGGTVNPPVTPSPVNPPTNPPPTNAPTTKPPTGGSDTCQGKPDGFHRSSSDCSKFYQCAGGQKFDYACPAGLVFNTSSNSCDYPENVQC
ncbi:CHIA.2 family protein [Megaselia abdita]